MINAMDAATYLSGRYRDLYHGTISEMQLHKLLYFAQREALITDNQSLFNDTFQGWRFGPVLPSIRYEYPNITASSTRPPHLDLRSKRILDETLRRYGEKDPWSLSRLSHGEYSWQKSREGISEYDNSANPIKLEDIRVDAQRIKERRAMLNMLGISR